VRCWSIADDAEVTYDFEAHIAGRDQLIIDDKTLQRHHVDFAVLGRHKRGNEPIVILWSRMASHK